MNHPMMDALGGLDLERFLPYRLSVLSNGISQIIARSYADQYGLSVTEWRVIAVLGRYPGVSASEVAQRTAMDKVAVSRAVNRLVASGRVRRGLDVDDRRRSVLTLSSAGMRIYAEVSPQARAWEHEIFGCLSLEERQQLELILTRLEISVQRVAELTGAADG